MEKNFDKFSDVPNWVVEIQQELQRAKIYGNFKSFHEGYAVILEELDELWEQVKKIKPGYVNRFALRSEAIQVAAMAVKFIKYVDSQPIGLHEFYLYRPPLRFPRCFKPVEGEVEYEVE